MAIRSAGTVPTVQVKPRSAKAGLAQGAAAARGQGAQLGSSCFLTLALVFERCGRSFSGDGGRSEAEAIGGAWLLGTLMRRTRGTAAIAAPGERCVPRVRLNERTTSSVDLIWTAERASTWSDDAYELQRRWAPGHAGAFEARDTPEKIQAARDAVDEWVTVYQGARAQ